MSKRAKFVLVTWIGPSVSIMKKAKMSTDKAVIKDVIQVSRLAKKQSIALAHSRGFCRIFVLVP